MSAPPRSTVMLPRLATGSPIEGNAAGDSTNSPWPARDIPVGPGGGRRLSQALCLARVVLSAAVCTHLQMAYRAPLLAGPLGLARALVAIARHADDACAADATLGRGQAARLELDRVGELPDSRLVSELTSRLESVEWPPWVPRVGMVTPFSHDMTVPVTRMGPRKPLEGIACPLLAARVVTAMRGPVFMRDAAPSLTQLLNLFGGAGPAGGWELWLPVRPGTAVPPAIAPSMASQASSRKAP